MTEETKGEICKDKYCPFHGSLSVRGRTFKGEVKKLVGKRAVIEYERIVYHPKYERFSKKISKLHARIPDCLIDKVKLGSHIQISECRPLSKIIHFVVTGVIK